MTRICKFFGIHELGWLEFVIALYPILSAYSFGRLHSYIVILLILDVVLLLSKKRRNKVYNTKPFYLLTGFLFIHFLVWIFIIDTPPSYYFNYNIMIIVVLLSLIIIIPYINLTKLCSAINLVGIIVACGLVYQSIELMAGKSVSTIPLPFMPMPDETSRIFDMTNRPVSFFTEPQSYVSYMIIPLFLALQRKNLIYALIIGITILLSTSTTGIAMIAIMFAAHILTSKLGLFYRVLLIVGLVVLGFWGVTSEYTMAGRDKMYDTNIEENSRVANGPIVSTTLTLMEIGMGIPYASATDYCYAEGLTNRVILARDGRVFISAFWIGLIQYGIIGLLLYLNIYYQIIKKDKAIFPYWLCVIIVLFTNPDFIGANFAFILFFSYPYVYMSNSLRNEKNMYTYNPVRK